MTVTSTVRRQYVIRYDNRDTGQSMCVDFEKSPYTLSDMARDAVGVLDAFGIDRSHVSGASMGGMIAQGLHGAYLPGSAPMNWSTMPLAIEWRRRWATSHASRNSARKAEERRQGGGRGRGEVQARQPKPRPADYDEEREVAVGIGSAASPRGQFARAQPLQSHGNARFPAMARFAKGPR